jgi:hypothetical protein
MLSPPNDTVITIITPAYHGYWESTGCASQRVLEIDIVTAVLASLPSSRTPTILLGQSLGCRVLVSGLAALQCKPKPPVAAILRTYHSHRSTRCWRRYPQQWQPYRYLVVFLCNRWDFLGSLRTGNILSHHDVLNVPQLSGVNSRWTPA